MIKSNDNVNIIFLILIILCIIIFFSCKKDTHENNGQIYYSESGDPFPPDFSPWPGTYDHDLEIRLFSTVDWAKVHYTTDGSDPDIHSKVYIKPIPVTGNGATITIKAIAITPLRHKSEIVSATYTINWSACSTPSFNPSSGSYVGEQEIEISSTEGAIIKYTTDGSDPKMSSTALIGSTVNIDAMTELKAYAYKEGKYDSDVSVASYKIFRDLKFPAVQYVMNEKILVGPDNKPIVAFEDEIDGSSKMHVYKWNTENSWDDLGYFNDHKAELAVGPDSKPVIVYEDALNSGKAHVKKWNSGTSWDDLGTVGGDLQYKKISIGPDGKPVLLLLYYDHGYIFNAFKWESDTTWNNIGLSYDSYIDDFSLSVGIDNKPSLIYSDDNNDHHFNFLKWDSGTNWFDPGYAMPNGFDPIVLIDQDNLPIIMYPDGDNDERVHVLRGETDATLTDYGFASLYNEWGKSIALGTDNKPVVATLQYVSSSSDVYIMKWVSGTSWQNIGIVNRFDPYDCSVAVGSDNIPVVAFDDSCDKLYVYRCMIH